MKMMLRFESRHGIFQEIFFKYPNFFVFLGKNYNICIHFLDFLRFLVNFSKFLSVDLAIQSCRIMVEWTHMNAWEGYKPSSQHYMVLLCLTALNIRANLLKKATIP